MMSVAMAVPERLPGQGKDGSVGSVNGQGHDWADGTKKNQNENKLGWNKDNPGYRNHLPGGMVD